MNIQNKTISTTTILNTIILCIFVSSCSIGGTTRSSQFYVLDAIATADSHEAKNLHLGVGPILVPGYINRPQIVTKSESAELIYAEFERWAEPMDEMFTRTLTQNITINSGSNSIISHPWSSNANLNKELTAKIIKFENNSKGHALLIVQWQLLNKDDKKQASSVYSEFSASARSTSTPDRVSALNDTVKQFADEILRLISNQ
ncbi:MAG: PqiC family protein [Gammaproteobacteria bacterium]|nr:PqiC family protein [Gammaproteobacteria bacterium]